MWMWMRMTHLAPAGGVVVEGVHALAVLGNGDRVPSTESSRALRKGEAGTMAWWRGVDWEVPLETPERLMDPPSVFEP